MERRGRNTPALNINRKSPALQTVQKFAELGLRLPGWMMFEVYFRAQRSSPGGSNDWTKEMAQVQEKFTSFFEVMQIWDFLRSRNLDTTAAHILAYSSIGCFFLPLTNSSSDFHIGALFRWLSLFLGFLFMLLPPSRLVAVYLHMISFSLLAVGHCMSVRYVQLEQKVGGKVILEDFTQLERHGFHFLAQVMLALTVSCLLRIQSSLARASLAIYTVSIVARICGFAVDQLHVAHNFSCSCAMLIVCFYLLNTAPSILLWLRRAYRRIRACLVVRGLVGGSVLLWKKLKIPLQLCLFWAALFVAQLYGKTKNEEAKDSNIFLLLLAALAESTGTPLSLLALAVSVSYAASVILQSAKYCLHGRDVVDNNNPFQHGGYTQGITLILLCAQTNLLEMKPVQRAFLLCLVGFIVLSTLMQSLFELLEPHLLSLGAGRHADWHMHVKAFCLSLALLVVPVTLAWGICALLPIDLWLLIIVSNCLLTSLQTASATVMYCLFWVEARAREPWERLEEVMFWCRAVTRGLEFLLAATVIAYGLYESTFGEWSWISAGVLLFYSYFVVWKRLQFGWRSFQLRRQAAAKISYLARASRAQLDQLSDVCAICVTEMTEARVTPCGHFFHGGCLKKWLFVRQACPMCHSDLSLAPRRRRQNHAADSDSEEGYSSEESESAEDSEATSEYTLADSSDEDH